MAADANSGEPSAGRRGGKSKAAFRTISEVADELDVAQHVLRFWETKFHQIRPLKRGGGRRYYRPEDIDLLRNIKHMLYTDGYTIKGVQRLLRQGGAAALQTALEGQAPEEPAVKAAVAAPAAVSGDAAVTLTASQVKALKALLDELLACRDLLKR
jgi:DNA-binding transcriptional MerR regulator